ncbi:helix-turn-helix transcriptional regulator [Streptomyces chengbuensis]|uniref:helix-turn-helix domain-containing protein n=1 Tax=Streptomyces TaxID=1883 RepID=UPI0025B323C4|nr:helix-turn-helix transcriptional regulator [Streptomyces sp. HUAS CB01]WJY50875.1 helix-turn-helix transcriptional regulator [Streptomyces sp. HUAS CB01]
MADLAGVDDEPVSSDSLRTFGAFVQGLREHAGLSREAFAPMVRFSRHTVASIELGRRMPDTQFVELAEAALGNTGALRRAFGHLTRQPGLASWFREWARRERTAVSLCTYECRMVPGLLQSEGYLRALYENEVPPLSDEQVESQIAARLERQRLLPERPNVPFSFIVTEAVFRQRLGGAEVTRQMLDHVLTSTARRNVTLQIMPTASEFHACLAGMLQLLEGPDGKRYAYSEGQRNGRLIGDPKEVVALQQAYDTLRSQALTPSESRGLLERIRGAL